MRWFLLFAVFALAIPARAQIDFTLGPAVTWTEDVSALTIDPENPETVLSRDSLMLPVTIGLQGGLGLTLRRGAAGVRLGGRYLNTAILYDGSETLNRDALNTNFVAASVDLQYVPSLGPLRAYVLAGPELRYLLDLSGEINGVRDVTDGLDPISAVLNLGAGLKFELSGFSVGPELRYSLDLTGVEGDEIELDNGNTIRLSEAFDVNSLAFGLVFGGL
ncbi:MAG: hypothetical protein Rubg2KO_33120 [Rubricoccaceae bacterium]